MSKHNIFTTIKPFSESKFYQQLIKAAEAEKEDRKHRGLTGIKNRFAVRFLEVCKRDKLNSAVLSPLYKERSMASFQEEYGLMEVDTVNLIKLLKVIDATVLPDKRDEFLPSKTVFLIETIFQTLDLRILYEDYNNAIKAKIPKSTRTGVPRKPTHVIALGRGKR